MNNEYVTEIYFYLDDLKKKRAISSLFNLTGGTLHLPDDSELQQHKIKFEKKTRKILPDFNVDFDFFKETIFGDNYGPRGSWTSKSCASIDIYHAGELGDKTLLVTKLLRTLDPKIEILARAWTDEPDKELWIKSTKDNEFEMRNLHFNKNDNDLENIAHIKDTYRWIENELSFSIQSGILFSSGYKGTPYHDGNPCKLEPKQASKNFALDMINIFKIHKLLPKSFENLTESFNTPLECFSKLVDDYCQRKIITYPQIDGGWIQGQLGEEYADLIIQFCKKTNISIQDLIINVSKDSEGNEDPYQDICIQFTYKNKLIKWKFNKETEEEYFKSFSDWAKSALNGGYLVKKNDFFTGYILPKEVIEKLSKLGVSSITLSH